MPRGTSGQRREQILQTFATMLETRIGSRITTAALAREVGVSEAALYRHFPSKARMFEGLIEFIEETVFSRTGRIMEESEDPRVRCRGMLLLLLSFCERNPGFSRLLTGDALAGETERLRRRMAQFYDRMETELRAVLRDGELAIGVRSTLPANIAVDTMLALAEGHIARFVRSEFRRPPTENFDVEWSTLAAALFTEAPARAAMP
jgi:TetR/AcrR family transcriptional regulator